MAERRWRRDLAARGPLLVARVGLAHWFFGNLYEAVVRVPDRLATEHDHHPERGGAGLFASGSPVRYYVPAAQITGAAVALTAVRGWPEPGNRPALAVAASSSAVGAALTVVLVRTVIVRLLTPGPPLGDVERRRLLLRWHRLNAARLVLGAAASVALGCVTADRAEQSVHDAR